MFRRLLMLLPVAALFAAACTDTSSITDIASGTAPTPRFAVSGGVFTSNSTCEAVNQNEYTSKQAVYLNGGGISGQLPDGSYYVRVSAPGGGILGQSAGTVAIGGCTQLWSAVKQYSAFTDQGFLDTTNPDGVYKVEVCTDADFKQPSCKSDNFVVLSTTGTLSVRKFYDANTNGIWDEGETEITGWRFSLQPDGGALVYEFTPFESVLDRGAYTLVESDAVETNWFHTTPATDNFTLAASHTTEFGNVCVGAGGGLTKGFWTNKNGMAVMNTDLAATLLMLRDLSLVDGSGAGFNPTTYTQFKNWLGSANATNMAYMLSAQLAAMELNVKFGYVSGSALIYAPGTQSANALGFASVNAVMGEANASLGANPLTVQSGAIRHYQEDLKNALDSANNNLNFVQATPCPFSFAEVATVA